MKRKMISLAAALLIAFGIAGCNEKSPCDSSGDISDSISSNNSTSKNESPGSTFDDPTSADSGPSDPNAVTTEPLIVKCGDILEENGKRVFDSEVTCGNAFVVIYHFIESENGHVENAIGSLKPLLVTELDDILKDPLVGGDDLSANDFDYVDGVYRMKAEKAKTLLGDMTTSYSFEEYWKNQKIAELVSTEKISAEEAHPKVEEMLKNMGKTSS